MDVIELNRVGEKVAKPILDKTLNTPLGKQIVTTTEKATRGSSILGANRSSNIFLLYYISKILATS